MTRPHRNAVIVVFAKAPHPGLVKTRMTPPLSPTQAAELYAHLLEDVLDETARFAAARGLEATMTVHPADACPELAHTAPQSFRVVAQQGAGLSERMRWAVGEAAASGANRILLRGSDNPILCGERMGRALDALDEYDVVIAPDLDGGYGMIGVRFPVPELFDHPMSTGTVLEETLDKVARQGLRCHVMEPSFDLDSVEDFVELERAHRAGATAACPRTIEYFDRLDLWRHIGDRPDRAAIGTAR